MAKVPDNGDFGLFYLPDSIKNKSDFIYPEPINEPTYIQKLMQKKYTLPRLYIPEDTNGKPSVAPGKRWYIWFLWRNPETGLLNKKFKFYHDINRFKKVSERKAAGKALIEAYTLMLKRGFNPMNPDTKRVSQEKENMTCLNALEYAYKQKQNDWSENTKGDYRSRFAILKSWIMKNNLAGLDIARITKKIMVGYFNDLAEQGLSNTSVNNHRALASSLFGKLFDDDYIESNPIEKIAKRKSSPQKNKAFTSQQIKKIKGYLLKNDPYLYDYLKFITYAFMRPVEVLRLQISDIDLKNDLMTIDPKTENRQIVRIITQLKETLIKMNLYKHNDKDHVFTRYNKPTFWDASDKTKTRVFQKRFAEVKKHFGFNDDYGMYSFRHTFAIDLYQSFIKEEASEQEALMRMMGITRHKSIDGLKSYLREIGAFVPKDYSDRYSINF